MENKTDSQAYKDMLKENTKLHADKRAIIEAAERACKQADKTINHLHGVIDTLLTKAVAVVEENYPDSETRYNVVLELRGLTPLKINAAGQEK